MLVENPPEKVSWKSESQFIVESTSDFFCSPHHRLSWRGPESFLFLKENGPASSSLLSTTSFLIQYQRDYDSIHHNKGNGGAKAAFWSCENVLLLLCLRTYPLFSAQTSSIRWIRSVRLACWTHFSTTFEANLCCDSARTLPRTALMIKALSS